MNIGRFRIVRRLPDAGARDVFLAVEGDGREVVLQVLGAPDRNQGMFDPELADEAASYARMDHPNIVKVVELFSADGRFVIALEYVDGSPLNLLGDVTKGLRAADADACWIYVVSCVLDALVAAHRAADDAGRPAPVLHRNVNPSNVQIAWDGAVKLGNFNLGNVAATLRPSSPGFTWNTAAYLAPEQLRLRKAGPESDLYSTMLVLWELLAGRPWIERRPLRGAKILEALTTTGVPPLDEVRPDLDPRLLEVARIALHPYPARRTIDAAGVRDVLRRVIDVEASRRRFAGAVARARSTHEAPTVAPPPSIGPSPAPVVTELEAADLESVHPPPLDPPAPPSSEHLATLEIETLPAPPGHAHRIAVFGTFGLAACILAAAGLVRVAEHRGGELAQPAAASSAATRAPIPAATPAAPPVATPTATPTPIPAAAPSEIPANLGEIQPPASAAGHRIFVDGRVVGEGTAAIRLSCGAHAVRIGSAGRLQSIDVPCGRSIAVTR